MHPFKGFTSNVHLEVDREPVGVRNHTRLQFTYCNYEYCVHQLRCVHRVSECVMAVFTLLNVFVLL